MNADHPLDSVPGIDVLKKSKSMLIKATSIGLGNKVNIVLKTLMKLSPELQQNFIFLPESQATLASVVLVNADNIDAIYYWSYLERKNPEITPVWVYREKRPTDVRHGLKLPINEKKLTAALAGISPTRTRVGQLNIFEYARALKLLVVDDNLSVRKYMQSKLPELCHDKYLNIDFAESGEKAFDRIKKAGIPYDLVFLEVGLGDLNSYKICRWIKKLSAKTTVVMLTSSNSISDKIRGYVSGCDMFLTKPPKDGELVNAFQKINQQALQQ